MKIGVISDTHGCFTTFKHVFDTYFFDADLIIHAGDVLYHGPRNPIPAEYNPKALAEALNQCPIPIIVAAGNCDAEVDGMVLTMPIEAPYAHVFINPYRILVNHGHHLDQETQTALAQKSQANVFISGHIHIPVLHKENGIVYLNPGSPAMSKTTDGHGTIALIQDDTITVIDLITAKPIFTETLGG